MVEYKQYEEKCRTIRVENDTLLNEFESWLDLAGLSKTTINRHRTNVDFYINEFLLYEDALYPQDGADKVGVFLGYWFIRKAMWASESSIKSSATSLKKFYTFMYERGAINQKALQILKSQIKSELPEWVATMKRYDDPTIEPEDVWEL